MEINSDSTRIFIDFGQELPQEGREPAPLSIDGLTKGRANCDGVFFTHYHGDHVGLYHQILPEIPLYMEAAGKDIFLALQRRLAIQKPELARQLSRLEAIHPLTPGTSVTLGDLRVTPFTVDHSAYNSCMFLVEGDGKRLLHTGDYRIHGFRGKAVLPVLEKYVGQVDLLITEGTLLSRENETVLTEHDLFRKAKDYLRNYKNVFVLCASTNIDRLAGLCSAAQAVGKPFICDRYQAELLETVAAHGGDKSALYSFPRLLTYGDNLLPLMEKKGFCMPVRVNEAFHRIMTQFSPKESIVLYSMWKGYLLQNEGIPRFLEGWNWEYYHTSGHGTREQLCAVIQTVKPRMGIIPIHTEAPQVFDQLCQPYSVHHLQDGEALVL